MGNIPPFMTRSTKISEPRAFSPATVNRKVEIKTWICVLAIALVVIVLYTQTGLTSFISIFLLAIIVLSAILISFSNWMDTRTFVEVSPAQLRYSSPVRKVTMRWDEVKSLWATTAGRGWRITILSDDRHFMYRIGDQPDGNTGQTINMGFPEGELLAQIIHGMAGLGKSIQMDNSWQCSTDHS